MSYHKFSSDYLFNGKSFLENRQVIIADEKGIIIDLLATDDAPSDAIFLDGIVCPGFTNAHCHLELSHLKDQLPTKSGICSFLTEVIKLRNGRDEGVEKAMVDAIEQMERNGIVAVGDICNTPVSIPYKINSRIKWYNFIEVAGVSNAIAQSRIDAACNLQNSFEKTGFPSSIVPHAPYSVSDELFRLISGIPDNKIVSIHNQESEDEQQFFMSGTGDLLALYEFLKTDIPSFANIKASGFERSFNHLRGAGSRIFVHNVTTTQNDINIAADSSNWWCICANANLYITEQLPEFELFFATPDSVLIGTDSLASNHSLDILSEIKTILRHGTIKLTDLLRAAIWNGAQALGFDAEIGSFDRGKTPGILFLKNTQNGLVNDNTTVQRLI